MLFCFFFFWQQSEFPNRMQVLVLLPLMKALTHLWAWKRVFTKMLKQVFSEVFCCLGLIWWTAFLEVLGWLCLPVYSTDTTDRIQTIRRVLLPWLCGGRLSHFSVSTARKPLTMRASMKQPCQLGDWMVQEGLRNSLSFSSLVLGKLNQWLGIAHLNQLMHDCRKADCCLLSFPPRPSLPAHFVPPWQF